MTQSPEVVDGEVTFIFPSNAPAIVPCGLCASRFCCKTPNSLKEGVDESELHDAASRQSLHLLLNKVSSAYDAFQACQMPFSVQKCGFASVQDYFVTVHSGEAERFCCHESDHLDNSF